MGVHHFKHTKVYQKAFDLAMNIFKMSKHFPAEEKYSLTDQIRRSARSVCASLAEAYRKKRYPAHFVSKLTDADMENSETDVWLDFALACLYITSEIHQRLVHQCEEVGKLLGHMINNPDKY
jgi:four helix bundle protein